MAKSAKEFLESEVKRLVEQARSITRKADEENRSLSDEERMQVEGLINETTTLKSRIAEQDENERLLEAIENASAVAGGEPTTAPKAAKTLGDAFAASEGYKALKARGLKGNWTSGPVEIGMKLTDDDGLTVVSEADSGSGMWVPDGAAVLRPQILGGIQTPVEQRLTVAALLGAGTTDSNTVVFLKETVTSNGADVTAEGAAKPASEIDFDKVSEPVEKIATFLPISDEMIEDEPQVVSYINGRLMVFVRQREEEYLVDKIVAVAGATSSAGELDGDNIFDGIAAAIMHVREDAGLEPDGILVSPLDAAKMDVARAAGGEGLYFSGGPYAAPSQNPWGLRRVVTTAVADGAPIVGAFNEGATVWRRGGLSVEASNSHADYFRRNLTALRAEERLALTIFRDDAFQVVSDAS
jgi:HK97 family phage major capsid protein